MNPFDVMAISVSRTRLEAYRMSGDSDLAVCANYLWNIEVSEALYPALQMFEVALRNSVHTALTNHFKSEQWFLEPGFLLQWQADEVRRAMRTLAKHQKPRDAGRIIAELSFGFWGSMFNRPYEELVWHADKARLLKMVFPGIPRSLRTRQAIWDRIERIRRLRNRVFHYEPVWNRGDLGARHREIVEALSWISVELAEILALSDRFDQVEHLRPARKQYLWDMLAGLERLE